ncbi:MAG TPA: hypothetical protein VK582_10995 [Pyrinomonadaceae bacterium]|nr:hypothetical protein [Pyrinomonadaceae bacterium]
MKTNAVVAINARTLPSSFAERGSSKAISRRLDSPTKLSRMFSVFTQNIDDPTWSLLNSLTVPRRKCQNRHGIEPVWPNA